MKKHFLKVAIILCIIHHVSLAQKSDYATAIDSTPIYYKEFGKGKPLLIINGGPGMNSEGFGELAEKLAESNRAIIYDQRGTGHSKLKILDSTTITIDLMVADIESLRQYLNIESWSVLGHSFGGILASYYATKYSQRIEKLILSSSGGIDLALLNYVGANLNSKLSKVEADSLIYWNKKIAEGDTSHATRLGRGRNLAPAYLYDKKFVPVLAERLTQGNATINQLVWDNLRKIKFNCAEQLKSFNRPVLLIQGKQDIIKPETVEKTQQVFSNAKVVYMEHCGHYGWLDNAEVYFKELNEILDK